MKQKSQMIEKFFQNIYSPILMLKVGLDGAAIFQMNQMTMQPLLKRETTKFCHTSLKQKFQMIGKFFEKKIFA